MPGLSLTPMYLIINDLRASQQATIDNTIQKMGLQEEHSGRGVEINRYKDTATKERGERKRSSIQW